MGERAHLLGGEELREYARSSEGRRMLLRQCDLHGVLVLPSEDPSLLQITDLEVFEEPPAGYESCSNSRLLYTDRGVNIKNNANAEECSLTLIDCFSASGDKMIQVVVLDETEGELPHEQAMKVSSEGLTQIRVRCIIPDSFTGVISQWLILRIKQVSRSNVISVETFEWICGLLISFTVVSESKPLSVDAKPFTSRQMRMLFDLPVKLKYFLSIMALSFSSVWYLLWWIFLKSISILHQGTNKCWPAL